MAEKARNSQLQLDFYGVNSDVPARTPPQKESVHSEKSTSSHSICSEQSRLDGTQKDIGTEGELTRMSRRKGRRFRRQIKRLEKHKNRCDKIGGVAEVFNYRDLYKAGKKCCNGVRWKQSVQNFETHLFSGTAVRRRAIVSGNYRFSKYNHFNLCERGKVRPIDAPRIQDRQVEKVFTQKVLLPLYLPSMIHNNGASLPNKGFHFSQKMLVKYLSRHFRKYGRSGGIILADGKKFFPSANHQHIYDRHKRLILDDKLREFGDAVVQTVKAGKGMPLGVEPSQAEMIAYPSEMDNYLAAQCQLKGGHYMDDFYYLLSPNRDYREVLKILPEKASFELNRDKTRYIPLTKIFRYCKTKYILTESGKVIRRANRTAVSRDRRKIKALYRKVTACEISFEDVWTSVNGMLAYLEQYHEHKNVLKLRRLFYSIFGFSCESIENFRKQDEKKKYICIKRFKSQGIGDFFLFNAENLHTQ